MLDLHCHYVAVLGELTNRCRVTETSSDCLLRYLPGRGISATCLRNRRRRRDDSSVQDESGIADVG